MRHQTARQMNAGWFFRLEDLAPEQAWQMENLASWDRVTLPHSWNALDTMEVEVARHYTRAVGWYVHELAAPPPGERLWVEFEAASQRASIWLNGRQLGEHVGGYTAFTVELAPEAEDATRPLWLALRVGNLPDPDLIPSDLADFFLYGGLTRNVWCYTSGPRRLASLHCKTTLSAAGAALSLRGRLDASPPHELRLEVQIFSPQHTPVLTIEGALVDEAFVLPDCVIPQPERWSPDNPALYTLHATLRDSEHTWDTITEQIGLREFAFPAGGLPILNGQPLRLSGTHRHEDWAGYGSGVPDELTRQEMRMIKEAGFNFVRLAHYPQAAAVLEACDELGLLVWEELPWCRGGVGGDLFRVRAQAMLREMIEQHFNHPSIIFWGLGNELDWESEHPASTDEQVCALLQTLQALALALDPQRLTALRRFEPGANVVDVYSPSIWSGWYRGRYTDYEEALHEALTRYPRMLHIEWGGDSHYGRHSTGQHLATALLQESDHAEQPGMALRHDGPPRASRDSDWSESYMLDLMEWHLQVQLRTPRLAGHAQWIFKDFGTPLRPENPIPYVNQKGLLDRDGRPKALYYLFQSYLADRPMCSIEAPTWSRRVGRPGETQRVRVYSNCPYVALFVNGNECGTRKRDVTAFPAAGLVWHVLFRPGPNEVRAVGRTSAGKYVEHTITLEYTETTVGPATAFHWQTEPIYRQGNTGSRVTIQIVDAHGHPIVTDRRRVSFSLLHTGALVDRLGTGDGSRAVELANGQASIIVLTDTATTLLVSAEGLPATSIPLQANE